MAISKIILNGVTQMDLTSDTVAANNLISPNTAHGADGEAVVGTATSSSITMTDEVNTTGVTLVITTSGGSTPTPSGTWTTIFDDYVYVWEDGGFNVNNTALPLFGADEQWRVTYFDGTVYECTTAYNGPEYYIGNLVLSDLSGLPFNIVGYTWSTVGHARVSIESPTFFPLKLEKFVTS